MRFAGVRQADRQLAAVGVPEADATAAVFTQRLFSSYLPPIWGWITLIWMRKKEYR